MCSARDLKEKLAKEKQMSSAVQDQAVDVDRYLCLGEDSEDEASDDES